MVVLEVKATLENIEEFYTNHPDYSFLLKLQCTSCGEISDKWHDVTESITFSGKVKSETHYLAKCKLCGRENSLGIKEKSNGKYISKDQGSFKPIVTFLCRGLEPTDFKPIEGWIAKADESGTVFENIDLSEKEWVDYDENKQQSVGIYEFEHRFVK
ncbi:unnamed protein product [Brassicogethes aeneus]|uniref:Uncharacterized protein n=1 Tax=Brassicogethes aeneus TaxID=1431903 RepID=A0A9P0BDR6_BRAAE|nr:unnamed protein product [Brassicogethes aeneus]